MLLCVHTDSAQRQQELLYNVVDVSISSESGVKTEPGVVLELGYMDNPHALKDDVAETVHLLIPFSTWAGVVAAVAELQKNENAWNEGEPSLPRSPKAE